LVILAERRVRHGKKTVVLLVDVPPQKDPKRQDFFRKRVNRMPVPLFGLLDKAGDGRNASPALGVFNQHHAHWPALVRDSALLQFREKVSFLFPMVALVYKVAKEIRELSELLCVNYALSLYFPRFTLGLAQDGEHHFVLFF
jgi:hypothetical protein